MTLKASIRDAMTSVAEADLLGLATDILLNAGVQSISDGDCLVSERGAGANMSVDVALGTFWIEKSSFVKNSKTTKFIRGEVTAIENAVISANASGNDRIDLVCIKYLNSATPTSSDGEGVFEIHVEEGTPAGSPTAPVTPNDCEAIAQVYVSNGASSIVDANITDVRREIKTELKDDVVATAKIQDSAVTTAKIDDDAVTTAKILDDNVTPAKLTDEAKWWEEIGRTTLGSNGDTITVSGMTAKKYLKVFVQVACSGDVNPVIRFNNDSGNNYAFRISSNGGADITFTSQDNIATIGGGGSNPRYIEFECINIASQEKLVIEHSIERGSSGAGNLPSRREVVGKWANTSNAITRIDIVNTDVGDILSGSEVVVLGHD